jgi:gliding motility-associated-like protein
MTATDASGNSGSCISTVTVLDTIVPIFVCKDTTIYLDISNQFLIDSSFVFTSAFDNCGVDSVWISKAIFTCNDLGSKTVTVYALDRSGNVGSCTSTVTVRLLNQPIKDTIAVQINASNFAQICLTDNRLLGTPTTYSLCKVVSRGNLINYNDTCFTYSQTSSVKYLDTACVIVCDDCGICDTTVLIFVPTPDADTIYAGPVVPVSNLDTCVVLESTFMTGHHVGTCDSTGTSSAGIPLTLTGLCVRYPVPSAVFRGDSVCIIVCDTIHGLTICDTTLIVYIPDTIPPIVICKTGTAYLDNLGIVTIDTSNVVSSVTDNTLINAVWLSNTSFNCSNVGPNTVTLYARDTNRNIDSCTTTITVLDTIAPTVVCQNITISLDSNGNTSIVALDIDGGSSDNCAIATLTIDNRAFNCSNIGQNSVTLTVTDIYGNSSTCIAIVTVEDGMAPLVSCPADKKRVVRNTTCTYLVEDFTGLATWDDNCDSSTITVTQFPSAGTEVELENESVTVTITTTDGSLNSSTCTFEVYARCVKELRVTQFISPNGDGLNDTWEIPELANYPNNVVKVFNRWGNRVLEEKGYSGGWNGVANINGSNNTLGSGMLPEGTYFYIIDLGDENFEPYVGYMQIKR